MSHQKTVPPTLTESQIDFFELNGYLHLPQLLDADEIKVAQDDSADLIQRGLDEKLDDPTYFYGDDSEGKDAPCLFRVNDILTQNARESFQLLLGHPKLLSAISQVVHGDYFASKVHALVFKIPERGIPIPWHQDPVPVYRFPVFNVDIYLDESTPDNGGLFVIPRSHLSGYHGTPEFIEGWTKGKEADAPGAVPVIARPGDVVFHNTSVVHGSFRNRTPSLRRTIYFHIDHFEDIHLRPGDDPHRIDYLNSQRITQEAVQFRRQQFPDEPCFDYNLLPDNMPLS
jgi:phytanoyl-CoA hydroxylase